MQWCSPLSSASSFTLRCPFYSLCFLELPFPIGFYSLFLEEHMHTHSQTLWVKCIHFLSSDSNLKSFPLTSLPTSQYCLLVRTSGSNLTPSQKSHIGTLSPIRIHTLSGTLTPPACPVSSLCTCHSSSSRSHWEPNAAVGQGKPCRLRVTE